MCEAVGWDTQNIVRRGRTGIRSFKFHVSAGAFVVYIAACNGKITAKRGNSVRPVTVRSRFGLWYGTVGVIETSREKRVALYGGGGEVTVILRGRGEGGGVWMGGV